MAGNIIAIIPVIQVSSKKATVVSDNDETMEATPMLTISELETIIEYDVIQETADARESVSATMIDVLSRMKKGLTIAGEFGFDNRYL